MAFKKWAWSKKKNKAVLLDAKGYTPQEIAPLCQVTPRTIRNWRKYKEYKEEKDTLSQIIGVAARAFRLRLANTVCRKIVEGEETDLTKKDLLEWLKYAKIETDDLELGLFDEEAE